MARMKSRVVTNMGMHRFCKSACRTIIVLAVTAFAANVGLTFAAPPKEPPGQAKKITQADRQAAADRAAAQGFALPAIGQVAALAEPTAAPHYFSHPNYANSQFPVFGTVATYFGNPLLDREYASDFPVAVGEIAPVFVVQSTALPDGTLTGFQAWNQASAAGGPFPSAGNVFSAYVLRPTAVANVYDVVFAAGPYTVPALADPLVSELATYAAGPVAVQAGDVLAFYGQGIPVDTGLAADVLSYPAVAAPIMGATVTLGSPEFPIYPQDRTYSFGAVVDIIDPTPVAGIRKFVDELPVLCNPAAGPCAGTGTLGQYIPVAVADTTTYADADYYEIAVIQYREQMHSDLNGTLLRGYVQLTDCAAPGAVPLDNDLLVGSSPTSFCGLTRPHYLGPAIVATRNHPVRILFRNLLPTGIDGDLFIPTDVTVMGSGMGPNLAGMAETDPQNPLCGQAYDANGARMVKNPDCFAENRATLHLHGGISPWISDGTPHQWTTPAGENTAYPDGVSASYVPDMWFDASGAMIASCALQATCAEAGATNNPGPGTLTFYYTNQQSARLMFYHDHAWGITRLNVLAGEAAAYIIQDSTEASLLAQGLIPADMIPLVLQDKTFVPSEAQLAVSDELWDPARWGGAGNLWLPHVYSPAQNPGDTSGVNQFGRWAYGPWFWPPTLGIAYPEITNAYYDPTCDANAGWCEPAMMPGTPFNSMGMEAFHDTPIVNGTAYPTYTVDPKSYRLRILNAASDRFFNLSLYQAVDANGQPCDVNVNPAPAAEISGVACTEVALDPTLVTAALTDPAGSFPTPVSAAGPNWMQIGTEGGFLPAPTEFPAQPITWVTDPTVFNAGNVDQHSLLIGPAERADVIVDFSAFAGKTLILYNDAPAAFPARDPRYDYYTGNPDLRDTGGAESTLAGYGPNTRTVMQIKVAASAPAPAFDFAALQAAFKAVSLGGLGVFEMGQHPIIVGQGAYNSAYGTAFQDSGPLDGLARITDFSMTFATLSGTQMNAFPFQNKAIQDEMGEAFEKDYGRMSGNLGLEAPQAQAGAAQNLILYPFVNPVSELIDATLLPRALNAATGDVVEPLSFAGDGTQIWKITHNGVDTHPVHFHLFDVQLINRVGWDGIIRKPDANELGWKDTVRISPLEDTIVALRPIIPVVPFDLPNSERPLNPMMPIGSTLMFTNVDANGDPTDPITNLVTNFGWEYVWHCHILSHEEMDMMRPISVAVPPLAPSDLAGAYSGNGNNRQVVLTWLDNSLTETSFVIRRAILADGPWTDLGTAPANVTTFSYRIGRDDAAYFYQVFATNLVGYAGTLGYSTLNVKAGSNIAQVGVPAATVPAAPTNLTAAVQPGPQILLGWNDNSTDESGFVIERATGAGAFAALITVPAGTTSYVDTTVTAGTTYTYRVAAVNAAGLSAYTNEASVSTAAAPLAPASVTATATVTRNNRNATVTLSWADVANETGYTIQSATDPGFTVNVVTASVGANITSFTSGKLARTTPYYFRVLAFNASGPSAWTNATPFPIVTP